MGVVIDGIDDGFAKGKDVWTSFRRMGSDEISTGSRECLSEL